MPQLTSRIVASGLKRPVFAAAPPGDFERLFLVEQHTGLIKILRISSGTLLSAPFLEVKGISIANEQGLLGLAFHPRFAENGFFYVNCTERPVPSQNRLITHVRRYQVSATDPAVADPASVTTVLTIQQPPPDQFPNHKCGWLSFGPKDGLLYIGSGDGGPLSGNDPNNRAQDLRDLLGKLLRIDVDGDDFPGEANRNYAIPPTNPFAASNDGTRREIWARGLRNPWRNSFDRLTGDLYIADVGQNDIEELNFQPATSQGGENYGWRAKEGSDANPNLAPSDPIPPGAVDPIHEYTHGDGNAVVGGYVYRGAGIPGLEGTYFFADLNGRVWSFRFDGTNKTEFTERTSELAPTAGALGPISSFGEDAAGELYLTNMGGNVLQIVANH